MPQPEIVGDVNSYNAYLFDYGITHSRWVTVTGGPTCFRTSGDTGARNSHGKCLIMVGVLWGDPKKPRMMS